MMNRNHANRFQPRMNAGLGLLGEAPSMGNQGQMEPVSMGMKRMTGGLLGKAPQQHPRGLIGQNKGGRDLRERPNFRAGQDPQVNQRGFMHEQEASGYHHEEVQAHRGYHSEEVQQHRGYPGEQLQQPQGYHSEEVQQHGAYTGEEDQQYGGYTGEEVQQYGGYSGEEAQQYGGFTGEEAQQYGGYAGEEAQQHEGYPGEEIQQPMGYPNQKIQQHRGYPNEEVQSHRGYLGEKVQPRRALLEQPGLRRGMLNKHGSGMEEQHGGLLDHTRGQGQGYEAQDEDYYQEDPPQRGLLDEPVQRGFANTGTQGRRRGLNEQAMYDKQPRGQRMAEQQGKIGFGEDRPVRSILKKQPLRQGMNERPAVRRDEQAMRRGMLKQNDGVASMLERRDRQTELMEKAEVQMRMIQEERQKEEILKRTLMERIQQQEAVAQQQQLMLKAQLQQQQQLQARHGGDGLLGVGPNRSMQAAGRQMQRAGGGIPSLFDVPTKQIGRAGLGKRSSGPAGQRSTDSKRARVGPSDNRSRSNQRDRRESNEQKRNGNRSRPSRFDSSSSSRSRDRKDSDSRRSTDSRTKTPERSSQVKSPRGSQKVTPKDTKIKDEKAKESTKVASKVKEETIKEDSKVTSKDVKGKEEKSNNSSTKANKMDVKGQLTEVTVTMGNDEYDPAEPTGDIVDNKDGVETVEKKEEPISMEIDDNAVAKKEESEKKEDSKKVEESKEKEESKKPAEESKPMEISLTVTVNKKGRSVNDSDKAGDNKSPKREKKYKCNLCSVDCWDEESFARHINGMKHTKKMQLVMSSSTTGASLLSARKQAEQHLRQIEGLRRGGPQGKPLPVGKALETHCKVCNKTFRGAFKDHKDDPKHKARGDRIKDGCRLCKVQSFEGYSEIIKHWQSVGHRRMSWPECKLCNQRFKSPRKFVQHCKTDHHIKNKLKNQSNDDSHGDEMEELVTLDTVGFEDDMDMDDMDTDDNMAANRAEDLKLMTSTPKSLSLRQSKEEPSDSPIVVPDEYDPEVAVGQDFVVPVSGFFCKLCHKFYNSETIARGVHCQSQAHFRKYKKVMVTKAYKQKINEEVHRKSPEPEASKPETDSNKDSQEDVAGVEQGNKGEPEAADETDVTGDESKMDHSGIEASGDQSKLDHTEIEASAYETADEHGANETVDESKVDQSKTEAVADKPADEEEADEKGNQEALADEAADEKEADETGDQSTMDQSEKEASADEEADEQEDNMENVTVSEETDDSTIDLTSETVDETPSLKKRTVAKRGTAQKSPRGKRQTARRGRKV